MGQILTLKYAASVCKDAKEFRAKFGKTMFDHNGRAFAPWRPNVKGMRYERGKLVPRHVAR